ncbi:MAG: hypothetical protein ACFFAN_20285 [Promethearchaeota archaeon]
MTDNHNHSFFGQTTGLTIRSFSKSEPHIFLNCIKKKSDDTWEKPSLGEGKTIKCSLEEMVMILQVLNRKIHKWSTVHIFNENTTQISFNWEGNENNKFWTRIGDYSKVFGFAQVEIFRMILEHILKEKIKYATVLNVPKIERNDRARTLSNTNNLKTLESTTILETINKNNTNLREDKQQVTIEGNIKNETEKAILIAFNSDKEVWIPKSAVHSQYNIEVGINQKFIIDKWILERNKLII